MQLLDRIEKRRFVGREFLLWLWFEIEIFQATLATAAHGRFGLWIEKDILLSAGKEVTRIKGMMPAASREAKEALLLGKLPERAGFHLSWREEESSFAIKGEPLALVGLALPTVLGGAEDEGPVDLGPKRAPRRARPTTVEQDAEREQDDRSEVFYERMRLTRDIEGLVEALYADFLGLRLGPAWDGLVVPTMRAWSQSKPVDETAYRRGRSEILGKRSAAA